MNTQHHVTYWINNKQYWTPTYDSHYQATQEKQDIEGYEHVYGATVVKGNPPNKQKQ